MNYQEREIKEKTQYCLNCKTKPCVKGCPLNNDIPNMIQLIKNQDYEKAYEILTNTTVLSAICGRICPHKKQCEGECIRGVKGKSVDIGTLEAFLADIAIQKQYPLFRKPEENKNKKVAVVGSGPAGLTCASYLIKYGFQVTIYEKQEKLGGILRYGIPDFRLDKVVLENTISKIIDLGIEVKCNQQLGKDFTIPELERKYDAIFLGIGANQSSKMGMKGEELKGVYGGNELLEKADYPDFQNKKVAVIGGGNVAVDTARMIKRLGAKTVTIIYRRAQKQMPAEEKEIQQAKQEGIYFLFQTNLVQILGDKKVEGVECIKTKLVKKEGETREVPINIENSNDKIDMDYVIIAVGARTDINVVNHLGLELSKKGYIQTNENYMTSTEGVFAGGDLIGSKATVAWAAKSGREAAKAIKEYLK